MERKSESAPRRDAALTGNESPEAIGAYLRRQRSLRGISLEALHKATQIPLRSLERLEAGAFDNKPDGFVRGLVRTVAEALGLNPSETVARMLREAIVPDAAEGLGLFVRQHVFVLAALTVLLAAGLALWIASRGKEQATPSTVALPSRRDAVRDLWQRVEVKPLSPSEEKPKTNSSMPHSSSSAPQETQPGKSPTEQRAPSDATTPSRGDP